MRKGKSASYNFGSLLVCILFYVQNTFHTFGQVSWMTNKSIAQQISEFIEKLRYIFQSVLTSYFEYFKKFMKQRLRIPISLVEKHYDDFVFLVDANHTYVQATIPRVRWIKPFPYEINVDEAYVAITTRSVEDIDKSATSFCNYKEAK